MIGLAEDDDEVVEVEQETGPEPGTVRQTGSFGEADGLRLDTNAIEYGIDRAWLWPSAAAITRLEQTFDWVLWIEEAERKLVWSRAARVPWKQISGELGCDRTTAWRRWQLALTKIAARLNAQ